MRAEGKCGKRGDFAGGALGKFGMSVEAGADGGAANGEIVEAVESHGDASAVAIKHINVAGNFLAEGERCGVLQMRAADLDDVRKFFGFGVERVAKIFYGGEGGGGWFGGSGERAGGGAGCVVGMGEIEARGWSAGCLV